VYEVARYPHALERPFVGTTDVVNRLAGRFRLGVIANQSAGTAERLCDHGWRGKFSLCISSTEEGLRKPDPAIFRLALDRAGCRADQAVMVGDRIDNDIAPAKAIGMATIRIRQGLSIAQEPKDAAQEPDITIPAITALPAVLGLPFS
jgi:HAD superfamily hydrolase (TIGR01549 family)